MTISDANIPKYVAVGRNNKGDYQGNLAGGMQGFLSTEIKPHTASMSTHSMKTFDVESKTPQNMHRTHYARNPAASHSSAQVSAPQSEFSL